jgi:hypothetical protein
MHWTPPRLRIAVIAAALVACGTTADDDDTTVDAGLELDAVTLDDARPCVTAGDGAMFAQCCVFDAAGCGAGLACYWSDGLDHGVEDGYCYPPGDVAIGATCTVAANVCVPGAYCAPDENTPMTGTGTCRTLCNPASPACGALERCEVPFGDGTIGFCTGGAP